MFRGTGGSHVGLMLQNMWEKKGFNIHGILSCSKKSPRGHQTVGAAEKVALWVPEDDDEHGGLMES